jgi:signal transduction histidine kinase/ligand-binding sensor domain-containing protein
LTFATRVAFSIASACVLSAWCSRALALDPALDISQYAHSAWKVRDGFVNRADWFAQTPDGYLWLGTEFGLLRFDGVRNIPWHPPAGTRLPHDSVRVLLATRDGALWIGTLQGLVRWHGAKLTPFPQLDGDIINGLVEDREGTIWVGATTGGVGKLCAIQDDKCECYGDDGSLGGYVGTLYEDGKGNLWVTAASGLWRWKPGPSRRVSITDWSGGLQSISESADGALLVEVHTEVVRVVGDKVEAFYLPAFQPRPRVTALLRDRDGALWIGTSNQGLLHVHQGRTDAFRRSDGLSGNNVDRLFEDHEGNIWIATTEGMDRFRTLTAATTLVSSGVPNVEAVTADRDGGVWISSESGLERRWNDGRVTFYRPGHENSTAGPSSRTKPPATVDEIAVKALPDYAASSLFQDSHGRLWLGTTRGLGYLEKDRLVLVPGVPDGYIDSIDEDGEGNLWIAHRDAGLLRLSPDRRIRRLPWSEIGHIDRTSARLAIDSIGGGFWLGFFAGGIVHVVEGRVRESYGVQDGLGKGAVNHLRVDRDGTLWVATEGGLSRVRNRRIATLDSAGGLPCDGVDWLIDDDESRWLYMGCGLVRVARSDLDAWSAAVDSGAASRPTVRPKVLDSSDGVRGFASIGLGSFTPHAARSRDGKLWMKAVDGLTMVDPRHLAFNTVPPPVHVEQIVADRKSYDASLPVQLPPLVRDLQIDYTALSFIAPERVLFRYKLEGRDRDWQDAGNRRRAFYTDLPPGDYRFRVIAANNSGVWNEEGASLTFSIAPAYWQTNWFRALCVLAFIALLLALYRLRVRQLARAFNRTLDARVNERTRIARELHDTLLQSFHGLLLRFQTVMDLLPNRASEAKQLLASTIDQAADAITEGRDAVQGLRASATETNDLAVALRALGEELAADEGNENAPALRVEMHGAPRTLHPIVRDEIFRIAGEALHNAFRHAQAKQVEVELRYDERQLRVRVRDDGKGIDPKVLNAGGREGHFGMAGMRERAQLVGGNVTVWSAPDSGTEVELSIPAAHAYAISSSRRRSRFAERLYRQGTTSDS